MNAAAAAIDGLGAAVLAISAVEVLAGRDESWSAKQREVLAQALQLAEHAKNIPEVEREELMTAIQGLRQLSVSETCRRLLSGLGLENLKPQWKALYNARSQAVHGGKPAYTEQVRSSLRGALPLCTVIVRAAVDRDTAADLQLTSPSDG